MKIIEGVTGARGYQDNWSSETDAPFEGFETVEDAIAEDRLRLDRVRAVVASLGHQHRSPKGWLRPAADLAQAIVNSGVAFDKCELQRFADLLEEGVESAVAQQSLGSSLGFRAVRNAIIPAVDALIAADSDPDWSTFTVIKRGWSFTPAELDETTAKQIMRQFRTDLHRAGVFAIPGPLSACLHGEFDPVAELFQLHVHGVTRTKKAKALHRLKPKSGTAGKSGATINGYVTTMSGAAPIFHERLKDGSKQHSYSLKSFWPSKGVRLVDGVLKRDRQGQRIPEPYHTLMLLWQHRQHLIDMTLTNDVWCPKLGGSPEGRRLYLLIQHPFETIASNGRKVP